VGKLFTVITYAAGIHADVVYDIVTVPAVTPVTMPLTLPTVAVPEPVVLVHVPPAVTSVNVIELSIHTDVGPVIDVGEPLTVTVIATPAPHPVV
jgi:hypothetical protein